jgi:hypothetical protein
MNVFALRERERERERERRVAEKAVVFALGGSVGL